MSLSLIDYGTRADALEGAESAGYTPDVVRVAKLDSGRYQWDLRDFGDLASVPDGTAGELSAEVVEGVAGAIVEASTDASASPGAWKMLAYHQECTQAIERQALADRLNRLGEIDQDAYREVAHEAFYAETCRVMREGADTLVAGVDAAVEHVIQDGAVEVDAAPRMAQLHIAGVTTSPAEIIEEYAPADVELRIPGLLTHAAAQEHAVYYAGKLGHSVEMVQAGRVIGTVFPPAGGARKVRAPRDVVATEGGGHLARAIAMLNKAPAVRAERDWSVWTAEELASSYLGGKGIMRIKNAIDAAVAALDIDALRSFTFVGAYDDAPTTTLQRRAGRYLRAWIAKVEAKLCEAEAAEEASAAEAAERHAANAAAVAELLSYATGDD